MDYQRMTALGEPDKRHRKAINVKGQTFGRLLVISRAAPQGYGRRQGVLWLCKCECGNETIVRGSDLRKGRTKSCGCLRTETSRAHMEKIMQDRAERAYLEQERRAIQEECSL